MNFPTVKLKDISLIKTGKLDSNKAVSDGVYPFFTCDPNTLRIDDWAYNTEAVLLAGNNASGNYTAKYYKGKFNAYQRVYIIETANPLCLNVRYLCYALNQQLQLLKTMSSGSTTKFLTLGMLHGLDIPLPPIGVQEYIVSVLAAYDDLIENNQKQIKLLEEAAQRLYKEWFVDLRFPGYETTPIVDGIPEGWEIGKVADFSDILRRGISPAYSENGPYVVINQKCIRNTVVDFSEARRQEKKFAPELNLVDCDTLICSTGAGTLGRVGQVFGNHPNTTFDSHVTLVRASNSDAKQYLYYYLKSMQQYLQSMGKGSTNQLELNRATIQELELLVPSLKIKKAFEGQAQPIHDQITALTTQIILLQEARNAMLPKLMNGEIEV